MQGTTNIKYMLILPAVSRKPRKNFRT